MRFTTLSKILSKHRIYSFGICDYQNISCFLPCRNRDTIPQQAKCVIVCAFPYYTGEYLQANVCKYAMIPDYHQVVRGILSAACEELEKTFGGSFVGFSDISALPEKECALQSGLGVMGKNGLVIHPEYGSFFVIGEIVTDQKFPFSKPNQTSCFACGKCRENCPTGAIGTDGIDYQRCLSFITQRKGELTKEEEAFIQKNGLMWGCDQCQDCCPHNRDLPVTYLKEFSEDIQPVVTEENLKRLMKTRAFGYRGKTLLLRNLALLAAGDRNGEQDERE